MELRESRSHCGSLVAMHLYMCVYVYAYACCDVRIKMLSVVMGDMPARNGPDAGSVSAMRSRSGRLRNRRQIGGADMPPAPEKATQ